MSYEKILFISPAVQELIDKDPDAQTLLTQLKEHERYTVKIIKDYDDEGMEGLGKTEGYIGIIATKTQSGAIMSRKIKSAEGLESGLSHFISSKPKAKRSYQLGLTDDEASSADESSEVNAPMRSQYSGWCRWFPCCTSNREQSPLLVRDPRTAAETERKLTL